MVGIEGGVAGKRSTSNKIVEVAVCTFLVISDAAVVSQIVPVINDLTVVDDSTGSQRNVAGDHNFEILTKRQSFFKEWLLLVRVIFR